MPTILGKPLQFSPNRIGDQFHRRCGSFSGFGCQVAGFGKPTADLLVVHPASFRAHANSEDSVSSSRKTRRMPIHLRDEHHLAFTLCFEDLWPSEERGRTKTGQEHCV